MTWRLLNDPIALIAEMPSFVRSLGALVDWALRCAFWILAILRSLLGFGLATAIGFVFADEIYLVMVLPTAERFTQSEPSLIFNTLTGAFFFNAKVGIMTGISVALPIAFAHSWRSLAPSLIGSNPQAIPIAVSASLGLFILGGAGVVLGLAPSYFGLFDMFTRTNDSGPVALDQAWIFAQNVVFPRIWWSVVLLGLASQIAILIALVLADGRFQSRVVDE